MAGIGLFVSWVLDWGLWGTVPFVVLFVGTISTIGSNSMGLLLSKYPRMAGTASSLAGTLRLVRAQSLALSWQRCRVLKHGQ